MDSKVTFRKVLGSAESLIFRVGIKKDLVLLHMRNHKISLKRILVFSLLFFKFRYFFINNPNTDIQPVVF